MKQNTEPIVSLFKSPTKQHIKLFLSRHNKKKIFFWLLLVLVIVVIGAVLIYYEHVEHSPSHRAVFTVDGTKYTEGDINKLIAYPLSNDDITRNALSEQAFNYYKEIAVAQKLGLGLSSAQINQLIPSITPTSASETQKDSPWTALLAYDYGIQQELLNPNPSQYSGYAYVFYFAQHIQTGPIPSSLPNTGNAHAIAQDQSYAKTKADYYYTELKTNKMSPAQVLSDVRSDPKLCAGYLIDACQSVYFADSNPGNLEDSYTSELSGLSSVGEYIGKQTKTGISPIETGQVAVVTSTSEIGLSSYVNAYYYFVDLQTAHLISSNIRSIFNKYLAVYPATYYGWVK